MTLTTLVIGATAVARETAIAAALIPDIKTALLLEGLADGNTQFNTMAAAPHLHIARIAPGCLCCTGNLTMRVTLNRILHRSPARLYISMATPAHLEQIRDFLEQAPYDKLLQLTKDLHA